MVYVGTNGKGRNPFNKVFYFKDGRVEGVRCYNDIGNERAPISQYRRWGDRVFLSVFEDGRVLCDDIEVLYEFMPENVRRIFDARNREGIKKLKSEQPWLRI